jgi:hypothetical protein
MSFLFLILIVCLFPILTHNPQLSSLTAIHLRRLSTPLSHPPAHPGAYLLTQKDVFFTRADFCRVLAWFSDATEHIDVPPPTIFKPRRLWTGKQVHS